MGSVLSWANVTDVLTDMGAVLVVTLVAVVWAVRRNRYDPDVRGAEWDDRYPEPAPGPLPPMPPPQPEPPAPFPGPSRPGPHPPAPPPPGGRT